MQRLRVSDSSLLLEDGEGLGKLIGRVMQDIRKSEDGRWRIVGGIVYILLGSVTVRLHLIVYKDEWKCKWRVFLNFVPNALRGEAIYFQT